MTLLGQNWTSAHVRVIATRLVAAKIIKLARRGVREAPTLLAMTLKEPIADSVLLLA